MAGTTRNTRIEPRFESGGARSADGIRLDRSERLSGGGSSGKKPGRGATRTTHAKSKAKSRHGGGGDGRRPRKSGGGLFGLARGLVYWCLVIGIWGALGVGVIVAYYAAQMPNASTWSIPERPPNVRIVSVGGEIMANRGATGGEQLSLTEMSPFIPQAVMAIEDRRFQDHFGIDPIGLARAMYANLMARDVVQGGSTVTQQLAKNLFLSPEQTIERKVQEVMLAFWLEHEFTKDQIMEMYLNRVYFGSGAYGVEAASRRYFDKPASDVTLAEAALLAGLLKAPSRLSPARDPQAAEERAQVVLQAMSEAGYVSDAEVTTAMTQSPTRAASFWTGAEHYVADAVMKELPDLIGEVETDLIVETTVDMQLQEEAERAIAAALDENAETLGVSQGALVAIDGTGAIRAMVGGRDYAESQFNRATEARRQPGSAFKPFVFAAAMEMGLSPFSVRNDAPIRIGNWSPENYDQKFRGEVTLTQALASSLNTVAAQLVMEVGPENVVDMAQRLGIRSDLQPNASIALGTSETTLADLTAAYAPFMNGGYRATPHMIERVSTADGTVLFDRGDESYDQVLDPSTVGIMNMMLSEVVNNGTGSAARLDGWQVAGKTGTTQSFRDALFVGYTANLATGVWFGNDDGTSMERVTGGGLPADAWHAFMSRAHEGVAVAALPAMPNAGYASYDPGLSGGGMVPPANVGDPNDPANWGTDILGQRPQAVPQGQVASPDGELLPWPPPQGAPVPPGSVPGNIGEGGWDQRGAPADYAQPRRTTLLDLILGN